MRWIAAVCVIAAGCGQASYPVRGTVSWSDGSPAKELAGGFVAFESATADLNVRGEIDAGGRFSLSNLAKDDGLPPGEYQVMVSPPEPTYGEKAAESARVLKMLPMKYQRFETSGLTATVEAKENEIPVKIDKAGSGAARN